MSRRNGRLHRIASAVDRWDVRLSRWVGRTQFPPVIDRGLPALSRAADHSVLWMGIGGGLIASGRPELRRAGVRGLASVAVTSLVANQVGKRLLRRERPNSRAISFRRLSDRVPTSSSFPSGHAASAAAFAVGASAEYAPLAVPLGVLATAVGASRVYVGVHYASDVIAGAALGAGIAAVGARTVRAHHFRPPRAEAPADPQQPRPTGAGVVIVANAKSGTSGPGVIAELRDGLPDAEIIELPENADVPAIFADAAARCEVLGVAGGDGTVNAAAAAAMAADVPLVVVPAGTFNHFAHVLGFDSVADTIDAVRSGTAMRIDVGEAGDQIFVNTASLGSYPDFVKVRERRESRLGKPLAATIAMFTVLYTRPPLAVEIDGAPRTLAMLFIGNGSYHPRGYVPRTRNRLDTGQLDVRYVDLSHHHTRWRLALRPLIGYLLNSSRFTEQLTESVDITVPEEPVSLARDGEIGDAPARVRFAVRPNALTVYRAPDSPEN